MEKNLNALPARPGRNRFDRFLETAGLVALIALLGVPAFFYNKLPGELPIHFGLNGQPDSFGPRWTVWILPVIGLAIFIGLSWLKRQPRLYNFPQKITPENRERQTLLAIRLISFLNAFMVSSFAYITFATIQTALGKQNGLGPSFTPVFILVIFGALGFYFYQAKQTK